MAALQQMVTAEVQTVEQFIDLLRLEQTALTSGNSDALAGYAEQKAGFAARLNTLAAQRNTTLAAQGFGPDRAGVEAWCAQHPDHEEAPRAWATLLSLAGEARQLNELNGHLIHIRLGYNARALEVLRGGNRALDLYGPDGQSKSASASRINHCV